jgi:SAM-dependent methyltransferase
MTAQPPLPPFDLATRVFAVHEWSDPMATYLEMGSQTREALVGMLPDDWSFDGKRVLDFGSGSARTLRHFMPEAEVGELWGADIDAASIEWVQEALCPPLHAHRCDPDPPIGLEHGSFDLIWAISVFTHLADNSLPWLLELQRMLKPGGLLIATYMGRWNVEFFTGEPWDEDHFGRAVLSHNQPWDAGGPMVLTSDWWVRAHWGRAFEILEIAPQIHNMSWALMRKRDVELTVEDLEAPEDDEPREYVAARNNLRLTRRELERLHGRQAAELEDARKQYERSLSWQLTGPVRVARSLRSR